MNDRLAAFNEMAKRIYRISPELYERFNVKRGLRNADGTGVLVGLTNIGEVHGYIINEGEKVPVDGQLRYRGIDVNEIIASCMEEGRHGFEEVQHLLLLGFLPTQRELERFTAGLEEMRNLPEGFKENVIFFNPSRNIMNNLSKSVLSLYSFDESPEDLSLENILRQSFELISRFPIMLAYAYHAKAHYYDNKSLVIHKPLNDLSTAQNFMHMIRLDSQYDQAEADLLDLLLILHAEHGGGNNSAFATHVVASSGTDLYSAIAAAVCSLKGPRHGGANERVMTMMEDFKANIKDWSNEAQVREYIIKTLKKEAGDGSGLIYGMGHAVYTTSDPRAVMLQEKAAILAKERGLDEEFNLYRMIERLTPEIFYEMKGDSKIISANVDLYSGFVYKMLKMPDEIFTPLFAMSRVVGWCAHLIEEVITGGRIIRPAYKTVAKRVSYTPISKR